MLGSADTSWIVWGERFEPTRLGIAPVLHECDSAAVAFTTHAFAALGLPVGTLSVVESFGVTAARWSEEMNLWTDAKFVL